MRILYVGDINEGGRSWQRYRWLSLLGHSVRAAPTTPLDGRISRRLGPLDRILAKFGYPRDLSSVNATVARAIAEEPFDLLWVDKGDTVWPLTIESARARQPQMRALYMSEDDVFLPHNRSVFLTHSLRLFDIVFTTKPRNLTELPTLGAQRVVCVFQAFDPLIHRPVVLSDEERARFGADVSFVGTYEEPRAESLCRLAAEGVRVRVFGSAWDKLRDRPANLALGQGHLDVHDFVRAINASKINLNFLRRLNRDQHTSRSVEIPACGGFMLAERSDEHEQLFREGVEAEFFDDNDELVSKVARYLSDDACRARVAAAGRARCVDGGYSHADRIREMLAGLDSVRL